MKENSILVNIWSGKECINNRVKAQYQTWMQYFDEINIYTDRAPNDFVKKLEPVPKNKTINIIELGNLHKNWFLTPWQRAQPRFVAAMYDSFMRDSKKDWYLFGDDDTYFVKNTLLDITKRFNSSDIIVIGKFYCAWPDVVYGKDHNHQCLKFPQGGAGVLISNGMMSAISKYLPDCNKKYNSKNFAGSMRFGKCIEDHIDSKIWDFGKGIQNFKSHFFSRSPRGEIEDNSCKQNPASFHKLTPQMMRRVHQGIYSEWNCNNKTCSVDWSNFSCKPYKLYRNIGNGFLHLRFGYAISIPESNEIISSASSPIIPKFGPNSTQPEFFEQKYGDLITVRLFCHKKLNTSMVSNGNLLQREKTIYNINVICPKTEKF